jgi:ABC-type nitrate/sulfonate/bicarbonate transport system permease component
MSAFGRRHYRAMNHFFIHYGIGIAAIAAWQLATAWHHSLFFPTPLQIGERAWALWLSGPPSHLFLTDAVFRDILPSIGRMLSGWVIAVVVGVLAGGIVGRSRKLYDFFDPILQFLRALPGPALIPAFIILFGTETTMRITLIAFGSIWPVLLNTIEAVGTIDPVQLDTARCFRLPRNARALKIILPAAMPKIMAGAKVALSLSVILMVVSEFVASTSGIGYEILNAQMTLLLTDLWCGILLLAFLGFTLNAAFGVLERHCLAWHRLAHQQAG